MINRITTRIAAVKSNLNIARTIKLIWSVAGKWTIVTLAMIITETLLFFGSIYTLKLLIDTISEKANGIAVTQESILYSLLLAGTMTVLYHVAKAFSVYVTEIQSAKVSEYLNIKIHEKAVGLDLSFYESPDYFDILQRAKEAGAERPNMVIISLFDTLKHCLALLAIASVIFSIDWLLLPLLAVCMLPTLFVRIHYSDKLNLLRLGHTSLERQSNYFSSLITAETSAKEIRLYDLGSYFTSKLITIRQLIVGERLKISYQRTIKEISATALATLGFFACIAYVIIKAVNGDISIGDITVFLVVFPQVFNLLNSVTSGISVIYHNNVFVKSIFDLFDLKGPIKEEREAVATIPNYPTTLELHQVGFTYPHMEKPTLQGVSMSLQTGKVVAVVGMNGAGKSTLIKLICGLYEPSEGYIKMSGIDIRDISSTQYRAYIGAVFQDFCKYHVTVFENISMGNIQKSTHHIDEVRAAAIGAGADKFIFDLEDNYRTIMGRVFENGREISVGQWQKIAIARALYSPSRFMVLDEATSSLDANAEQDFFDSLKENINGRGALVVSHRFSTIRHADYIYVLAGGEVVEAGTYEQLRYANGEFASLFKKELMDEF